MWNILRKTIVFACAITLLFILGCTAFMNLLTPCYIPPQTKAIVQNYQTQSGIQLEPNIPWPYDSIWSAAQYKAALAFAQQQRQLCLLKQQQLNADEYAYQNTVLSQSIQSAEELKTNLFTPSGTIGSTVLPGLALTLGLMIKKPGQVPRAEHEKKLAEAKAANGTAAQKT